ncbi:MAG: ABC-type transport auxiliary lipoprotein family protein [Rhodospirillales bacterium]
MTGLNMNALRNRAPAVWTIVVMGLVLAGCAAQPPVPVDKYYRLQAVFAAAPLPAQKFPGNLEIDRFTADGLTAGRPIVYIDSANTNQLLEYHYHFWTQPPTIMLRDELVSYLRAAGISGNVVIPEMRLRTDYVMTGRILKLEQVLGAPNRARLELEISLRQPDSGKLLFLKTYVHETTQSSAGVSAAVTGLNEALNVIYSDLLADLKNL